MLFSRLSSYTSRQTEDKPWIIWLTWVIRLGLGAVFIFSGFTKAIDPWGTLYKIQDYLTVWGIPLWHNLLIVTTFALCGVEFLVGAMLCFGSFRRSSAWLAVAIMAFMLPLSLWIAISDPVPDCGCFGDAFIISNQATFWKNVVLTVMALWLAAFNRHAGWLITPALQWIGLVASSLYILSVSVAGYIYQPLLDFRPYPAGSLLVTEDTEEPAEDLIFVYEKDGERKEFTSADTLPDEEEGWRFVERIPVKAEGAEADTKSQEQKAFRIWDSSGEDVTEEELPAEGKTLLLLMPQLGDVSIASTWKLNSLYSWARKNNIRMLAAVAGSREEIENWKDLSMPEYPIYSAEDTSIKEVARGNPAIVYCEDGIIRWKSSLRAMVADDFMSPETSPSPMSFAIDNRKMLNNATYLYLAVMGVLIGLSFLPKMRLMFIGRRRERIQTSLPGEDAEEPGEEQENHS